MLTFKSFFKICFKLCYSNTVKALISYHFTNLRKVVAAGAGHVQESFF